MADDKAASAAAAVDAAAASSPSNEIKLTDRLWEACVEADWQSASTLCDEFDIKHGRASPSSSSSSDYSKNEVDWTDATLSSIIDGLGEANRRNPLMAAVLHVAIDVAASHKSFSLFSDTVAQDLVDAEERKRLRSGRAHLAFGSPLTTADFCPYLAMRSYRDDYGDSCHVVDEEERRFRRKIIAKLCRANPLWILLPMIPHNQNEGKFEDDSNFDDDLPRGTTPLHVAIRMRNVTLTRLLLKYCLKSAEITDIDGCIPLHHAVRPSDETAVLRRAVLTYQRSLNGGADNAPLEAGPNEVHSGSNLYYHGKVLFQATRETSELARCRVRRLHKKHKFKMLSATMMKMDKLRRSSRIVGGSEITSNGSSEKNNQTKTSNNERSGSADKNGGSKTELEKIDESKMLLNMYGTPSSLVRAMMHLGTVEEDSNDLVHSEWNIVKDDNDAGLETRKTNIAKDYPIVVDGVRTVTHGLGRPTRPWKTERQRTEVVKLLTAIHPQGMSYQCDDGGDTPLILACQTLEGDDGDDEEFDDMGEGDLDDAQADEFPNNDNGNAPAADEVGEDAADYEMDLPEFDEVSGEKKPKPQAPNGAQESNNEADADHDDDGDENDNEQPVPNNGEQDPLEAVLYMVAENGSNAMGVPDDDGDTALHAATRIGASPRLVQALLDTMPALASTPAEDGSTALHLACRRACHLAPEGNGGMGTYDAVDIRSLADAAGSGTLIAADDDGRTPFHVACRYRASPEVLAELAEAEGGRSSLLIRDTEGHAPLGVYCRHATDYHGLRVLVEYCPEAAAAMGNGRHLPLHRILATFNLAVNVDCLRLLGASYPRGLDALDSRGMTPLALLCDSYRGPLNVDIPKLREGRTTLERCLSNKIWLMARYLILAAKANRKWKAQLERNGNAITGPQTDFMLHATLRELSSSFEIIRLATVIHSDQLGEADSSGETPLHLCCRRGQSAETANISSQNDGSANDDDESDDDSVFKRVNEDIKINEEPVNLDSTSLNRGTNSSQQQPKHNPYRDYQPILSHILEADKTAAGRCNNEGKYPLNLLIDNGSTWKGGGVDKVLKAWPQALLSYDLSSGLFAMVLARTVSYDACSNADRLNEEQTSSIGATFQLLRGKPTVLEGANLGNASSAGLRRSKRARTK